MSPVNRLALLDVETPNCRVCVIMDQLGSKIAYKLLDAPHADIEWLPNERFFVTDKQPEDLCRLLEEHNSCPWTSALDKERGLIDFSAFKRPNSRTATRKKAPSDGLTKKLKNLTEEQLQEAIKLLLKEALKK